jgi:hypothetical protein
MIAAVDGRRRPPRFNRRLPGPRNRNPHTRRISPGENLASPAPPPGHPWSSGSWGASPRPYVSRLELVWNHGTVLNKVSAHRVQHTLETYYASNPWKVWRWRMFDRSDVVCSAIDDSWFEHWERSFSTYLPKDNNRVRSWLFN